MRLKTSVVVAGALAALLVSPAVAAAAQVKDVKAVHRAGQTFITFAEPGDPPADKMTWGQVRKALAGSKDAFRLYAHDKPITAANLGKARLIDEVKRFSGWNLNGRNVEYLIAQAMIQPDEIGELTKNYNGFIRTWHMDHPRMDRYPLDRFVIPTSPAGGDEKAGPLKPGTGLFVAHATKAGKRYYAVVAVTDGQAGAPAGVGPVAEKPGPGEPVRQRKGPWGPYFDYPGDRWVYVQWTGAPTTPRPMYFNWSVLVPPAVEGKASVELYFHDGNYSYAKPNRKLLAGSIQIATHDWPASGWYGYNDALMNGKPAAGGTVSNHTQKRIVAFLEWAKGKFPIDPARIVPVGADGAAMLAVNYPDAFAYVVITGFDRSGVLEPKAAKKFEAAWGPRSADIKDEKGRADWSWADLDAAVLTRPGKDLPVFICRGASWGRVKGYARGRGRFYDAMHKTGQPLFAHWAWGGTLYPPDKYTGLWRGVDIRSDTPVPAIANSTLDKEGEGHGNTNMAYGWKDVIDAPEKFEITITGRESAFDLTPRRMQNFKVKPGETIAWQATYPKPRRGAAPSPVAGAAAADASGVVTVKGVKIPRDPREVKITLTRAK